MDQEAKRELDRLTDSMLEAQKGLRRARERQARKADVEKELGKKPKPISAKDLIERVDHILADPGPDNTPMAARESRASHEIWLCAAATARLAALEKESTEAADAMAKAEVEATKAFGALVEFYGEHPVP